MQSLSRRTALLGGAASVLAITVRDGSAQGARAITFVTPFAFILAFVDVMHTQAGGYFAREGLDVTIEQGRGSAMALQQVIAGNALVSRTGGSDHIKAASRAGGDAVISVATISQGAPFFVISRADRAIRTPEDMAGRTVGVLSIGGATENVLDAMLVARGVRPDQVRREQVGNSPAGFALIGQGRIDAYITSAGVPVALRAANEPFLAWNTDDHAPIPGQCYVVRRESAEQNADLIVRFLRAVHRSLIDMIDAPNPGVILDRLGGFEIAEMRNRAIAPDILRNELQFWLTAGRNNILRHVPERWERGYQLMAAAGHAAPGGRVENLYTNAYVDRALA